MCQQKARNSASGRKQQAFCHVPGQQSPAASAESSTNGEFPAPGFAARNLQAGNIEAGDQKQAGRGGEQNVERRRSEERRVGKECRSRGAADREKKKRKEGGRWS